MNLQYKFLRGYNDVFELDFNLVSVEVRAETRTLRAAWAPELARDLMAYGQFNIDAEAELTALLSEEISREINREILNELRQNRNGFKFMRGYGNV